ncbi:hypothetical protein KSF_110620 [Reticulibacter mediterranei]|uniref:RNA polymerase sigma factor n=1 Tax=Reticulibacter mediterranei TaxID=2778369 RepID=A0A8J3IZV3_9CHLR|nr:RNA polymerase sigma factor [Reticulibacter mediterranei]GHP01015.1 hypothetical protein KSF_110620 [Reticulibacter mediterranei]
MSKQTMEISDAFVSPEERVRLLRYCSNVAKNGDVAEDLVQETLLEAWRHRHALRDVERREAWLFGIARNVCLRWQRSRGRDTAHLLQQHSRQDILLPSLEDVLAEDFDVAVELERKELLVLLDRALALLPPETRTALVQRYVEESPIAEIAAKLGTNTGAVAMRIQRGKVIMRRVLTNEMGQEIADYAADAGERWETTPLWCNICGDRHLLALYNPHEGKFLLKCPLCSPDVVSNRNHLAALKGMKGYRRLYARLTTWCNDYYRTGLRDGSIACIACGQTVPVSILTPEQFPRWLREQDEMRAWIHSPHERAVTVLCESCKASCITSLEPLALETVQSQQFLRAHPRVRTLPRQYLEIDGRAAILSRFASVTDSAVLDIISDEETFAILHIAGGAL